jgi:hypothetical protein
MSALETFEAHESVLAFITKNGLAGPDTTVTDQLKLCQARMIIEELGELAIAMHEHELQPTLENLVPVADGLADLLYVSQGLGITMLREPLRDAWNLDLSYLKTQSHLEHLVSLGQRVSRVVGYLLDPYRLRMGLWDLHVGIAAVAIKGYNLPFREVFREVQRSNMTKELRGCKIGEKGNQVPGYKGPGYEPPDIVSVIRLCAVDGLSSSTS